SAFRDLKLNSNAALAGAVAQYLAIVISPSREPPKLRSKQGPSGRAGAERQRAPPAGRPASTGLPTASSATDEFRPRAWSSPARTRSQGAKIMSHLTYDAGLA